VSYYRFILAEKAHHSIARLCQVLGVARSGYYAWCRRTPSHRSRADQALTVQIRTIHQQSRATYGAPRIHAELHAQGVRCGRKRIARLMRQAGLVGCHRRRRRSLTRRAPDRHPAPDLVQRDFQVARPNQLWVADLTYLATGEGWLYLAVILDVFSRQVVGWAMASHLRADLAIAALDLALWRRQPEHGLIHHSDQGSQYTALTFGDCLRQAGLVASMGSAGDAYDNAVVEAFFATLKSELAAAQPWPTRQAARTAVFDFIECWYNPRRRHSTLDYLSPIDYERRWQHEQAA
jgi:putative transposase